LTLERGEVTEAVSFIVSLIQDACRNQIQSINVKFNPTMPDMKYCFKMEQFIEPLDKIYLKKSFLLSIIFDRSGVYG